MNGRIALRIAAALALAGCGVESSVSRTLGARCDTADECDDRCLSIPSTSFPGGFCSVSCESNADCQAGASCIDTVGGVCLFDCTDDPSCTFLGDGWRCLEVPLREDMARRVRVCIGA